MATYLENGFLNFGAVAKKGIPFNILLGGRGIGKTFGALKWVTVDMPQKFYFTRRTASQLEQLAIGDNDPMRDINRLCGTQLYMTSKKGFKGLGVFQGEPDPKDPEKLRFPHPPVGVCNALSVAANTRGTGGGVDFKVLIYDEFIKLPYERDLKGEDTAFLDLYETLNRNRELPPPQGMGAPPLQAFLLSNSNRIDSPLLASLGLVGRVAKMQQSVEKTGVDQFFEDHTRGIFIAYYADSPISQMKRNTALYKSIQGNSYTNMALSNKFADVDYDDIKSYPIKEVCPVCSVGEITIYKHKGTGCYWVSSHRQCAPVKYGFGQSEFEKFARNCRKYLLAYYEDRVLFEDYTVKILFKQYFGVG